MLFLNHRKEGEFIGMGMARTFFQLGYTRVQHYAINE
ncbi:DUF4385 family protein [Alkalibacterium olivapovliticus]